MLTLFLHLMSLAAIFAFGYRFVYRPIAGRLAETERRMEERLAEMRRLSEAVAASDAERRRSVQEALAAFDHVRKATTDLVRQEVGKIAEAAVEDARRKTSVIPERL